MQRTSVNTRKLHSGWCRSSERTKSKNYQTLETRSRWRKTQNESIASLIELYFTNNVIKIKSCPNQNVFHKNLKKWNNNKIFILFSFRDTEFDSWNLWKWKKTDRKSVLYYSWNREKCPHSGKKSSVGL